MIELTSAPVPDEPRYTCDRCSEPIPSYPFWDAEGRPTCKRCMFAPGDRVSWARRMEARQP